MQKNDKLIEFRKSKGLTMPEMAEKIGVSFSFYSKVEYGKRSTSHYFLVQFSKAFPQAPADLFKQIL